MVDSMNNRNSAEDAATKGSAGAHEAVTKVTHKDKGSVLHGTTVGGTAAGPPLSSASQAVDHPSITTAVPATGAIGTGPPTSAGAPASGTGADDPDLDPELEAMKQRLSEMEQEAARFREMQAHLEKEMNTEETREEIDARSVYVGNVDYGATPEEIQNHFGSVGTINRVTILCDKWTGHPKGYAYVEFAEPGSVTNAMVLNETMFRGRPLKVTAKRTNHPFMNGGRFPTRGRGRGGPYRGGGGRGYGGYRGRPHYRGRSRGPAPGAPFYNPY